MSTETASVTFWLVPAFSTMGKKTRVGPSFIWARPLVRRRLLRGRAPGGRRMPALQHLLPVLATSTETVSAMSLSELQATTTGRLKKGVLLSTLARLQALQLCRHGQRRGIRLTQDLASRSLQQAT